MSVVRRKSESGFYHVINRGVSHSIIFEDDEDYRVFLRILESSLHRAAIEIHAFCLMSNHYHLLLRDNKDNLSAFMRHVNAAYALYFNKRYDRDGALFQSRFKSECVEGDAYFLTVLRYILQNPAKAGLAGVDDYPWSSIGAYEASVGKGKGRTTSGSKRKNNQTAKKKQEDDEKLFSMVNTGFAIELAGGSQELLAFIHAENDDRCADLPHYNMTSDEELRAFIEGDLGLRPADVAGLPRQRRNEALSAMKAAHFPIRRIERVTGVSHGVVARA